MNDPITPFITAAIETEDPFMDHDTNGIELYIMYYLIASQLY